MCYRDKDFKENKDLSSFSHQQIMINRDMNKELIMIKTVTNRDENMVEMMIKK